MNNNNIYKSLGMLFVSIVLLIGCNKDENIETTENAVKLTGLKVITYGTNSSSTGRNALGTSIALFNDNLAYTNYKENLEQQVEAWDDAFLAKWAHLDDDALNAKEEELNFDSEKPLTDFENSIGLQSIRQKYLADEETWLNNDILDEATDPDNDPVYDFPEEEMALINTYGEVQIGISIYKQLTIKEIGSINENNAIQQRLPYLEEGAYLSIDDGDYETLIDFNDGDTSVVFDDNVTVVSPSSTVSCKYGKTRRKFIDTAPGRKIKAIIKVPQPKFGANGKVKIKSYKRGGLFGWKKWRTNIAVGADGRVYNNCNDFFDINRQMTRIKRKKKRVYKWDNPNYVSHMVENGGMTGLYYQNGVSKELPLTW